MRHKDSPSEGQGPKADAAPVPDISRERAALLADPTLRGEAFGRRYTDVLDGWLTALLGDARRVALVAVGSYGRREMCPGSDVDVLLVHARSNDIGAIADRIWYPIWDSHLKLDHSVRTINEALAVAETDLKVELGLLDARFVAGDRALAADLTAKAAAQWRRRAGGSLERLQAMAAERHATAGEVGFLLEPELKEGSGGIRDMAMFRAFASVVESLDPEMLAEPRSTLLDIRVALHRLTGRNDDRLRLDLQDDVAHALGLADADALISRLAAAARTVTWQLDRASRLVRGSASGRRKSDEPAALAHGLVLSDDEIHLAEIPTDPAGVLLYAAASSAHHGALLSISLLEHLAAITPSQEGPWTPLARDGLVSLLGAGAATVTAMETLDQYDLITRVLPEWAAVRNRPQRNAFHRFTVDRHLMEAAAQSAALIRDVSRPDLLLVGALLHDIGKGYPGDHTDAGVVLMATIASRMGFDADDVGVLVSLVRHHLLLPSVATGRDLQDPGTIAAVAAEVGSIVTLELLAALTEADSKATGPTAWTGWKAEMTTDLVAKVGEVLRRGQTPVDDPESTDPAADDDAAEPADLRIPGRGIRGLGDPQLVVEGLGGQLRLHGPDRPGLFAATVGLLSLHGQDVRAARARSTEGGGVLDEFVIEPVIRTPDWAQFRADLERVLSGRLALEARLAERARRYRPRPTAAVLAEPLVLIDNEQSSRATVLEVRAPDGIGVLYRISRVLADMHLDIRHAKVSTIGHEVIDTFYVVDIDGSKVLDAAVLDEIRMAMLFALHQVWVTPPAS